MSLTLSESSEMPYKDVAHWAVRKHIIIPKKEEATASVPAGAWSRPNVSCE